MTQSSDKSLKLLWSDLINRFGNLVNDLHVPHQLMRAKAFDNLVNAFTILTIGSLVITIGRWSVASGPLEISANLIATASCYIIMGVVGVITVIASPGANLKEDAAKLIALLYFLFLLTILIYALSTTTVFHVIGQTPVSALRNDMDPLSVRLVICAAASAIAIFVFARRTRLFDPRSWEMAPNKAVWMVVYWVVTSLAATAAISLPDGV